MRAGEADGNGAVNVVDYSLLDQAYGSQPGDPNWDPRVDYDGNNIINMVDHGFWFESNGVESYVP